MTDRLDKLLKILAAEPNDAFTLYGVAQEYAKLGRIAPAIEHFDRCLAVDPGYCYAYYHKAKVQADHDQLEGALATLHAGIAAAKSARDAKALNEMQALMDSLS